MRNARVSDQQSAELELAEPIIQHIQSFLNSKEAAQTSVLSKPWYAAWSTRPSLRLDQQHGYHTAGGFSNFARTSLQRYLQLNLKLDDFELRYTCKDKLSTALADELIIDALKLGTNDLTLRLSSSYDLPLQVFAASSLTNVSISKCQIDDCLVSGRHVLWSRLASLTLHKVSFGDDSIRAILAGCPLIENFNVVHCYGFTKINVCDLHCLKDIFVVQSDNSLFGCVFDDPDLDHRPPLFEFRDHKSVTQFRGLTKLDLYQVDIGNAFFHDLAAKFPCLEQMMIDFHRTHETGQNVQISSQTLKHLELKHGRYNRVLLDVPKLCQFKYLCAVIPLLSSSTDLNECESDISFDSGDGHEASWFMKLTEFLQELKLSKISLRVLCNKDVCYACKRFSRFTRACGGDFDTTRSLYIYN